jgi:hypothetical protein
MAQLAKRPAPGDWNLGTEFDFIAQDKSFAILRERADAITKDQVKAGQSRRTPLASGAGTRPICS